MLAVPTYNPRMAAGTVWRLAPASSGALLGLVDRAADVAVLETAVQASRPAPPTDGRHLPRTMTDPFRTGSDGGSRFRRSGGPGVFLASETVEAAAMAALTRRQRFWADCPGLPAPQRPARMTALAVPYVTRRCMDLTLPPPDAMDMPPEHHDPAGTQSLAELARDMGADAIRSASPVHAGGIDVALLSCRAFAAPAPSETGDWWIEAGPDRAKAVSDGGCRAVELPALADTSRR